jgi:hypothetical protein
MKTLIMVVGLLFAGVVTDANAQGQAPNSDTTKNPVTQIDPEPKNEPADIHYVADMTRIAADELPRVVLDSLKKLEPVSWEKSVVYRDKQNKTFLVQVREGGAEKDYRFDREGRRIENSDERRKQ